MALNSFIYSKCGMVNMLREFTSHKELVRPAKTRFSTAFLTLSRIRKQKANLFRMFTSQRWITSPYYKEPNGKKIASIVMMPSFWNSVVRSCKVAGPLVSVLRLVDGENRPPMGYIYEAMDRAKEAIADAFNKNEARYQEYYDIIDNRWDIQLHQPLHAAGYYLNPEFYYKNPEIEKDKEVSVGLYKCIERMIADVSVQDKIGEQLEIYKRAEGLFGLPLAIRQKRNRFEQQKLNDLVFVKYNRALKRRYELRNIIDPISLNEIDKSNEWLVGSFDKDGENNENEYVFSKEDGLTYKDVEIASGAGEARYSTRSDLTLRTL
ncbi:hypothetical protein DCAR_0727849 [Daucus carota subsp. sativus]|uniref:Uncharacterized protein n=1 Tax=Daucus carota subsp. sativus TaxID=79200 RepID=A0AAF0XKC4_DAUCS|nr:PREDICTED: uncharacterized protein LOC108194708 [Daucus carota subsp. sativus]WOH08409.1 hypothetical protein DCAR_0727849 [Daucus carota subsp. sativus]